MLTRPRVASIALSPSSDTFASGGFDNTIRMWDTRATACQVATLALMLIF